MEQGYDSAGAVRRGLLAVTAGLVLLAVGCGVWKLSTVGHSRPTRVAHTADPPSSGGRAARYSAVYPVVLNPSRLLQTSMRLAPSGGPTTLPGLEDPLASQIYSYQQARRQADLVVDAERRGGYPALRADIQRYAYLNAAYRTGRLPELLAYAPLANHIRPWPEWPSVAHMNNRALAVAQALPLECDAGTTTRGPIYRCFVARDSPRVRALVAGADAAAAAAYRVGGGKPIPGSLLPLPVYVFADDAGLVWLAETLDHRLPGSACEGRSLGLAIAISGADSSGSVESAVALLCHETAHVMEDIRGQGHRACWLSEGTAMVAAADAVASTGRARVREVLAEPAALRPRLAAALRTTSEARNGEYAYYYAAAQYIARTWGFSKLLQVGDCVNGAAAMDQDQALRACLGIDSATLVLATQEWLEGQR